LLSFGTAYGHAFGAFMISGAVGVFLMGAGFDHFHSYTVPLAALCGAMVAALVLLSRLGPYRYGVETKPNQPINRIGVPSGA
jgi:cyanate permease